MVMSHKISFHLLLVLLFTACTNSTSTATPSSNSTPATTVPTTQTLPTSTPAVSPTPQPWPSPVTYGPNDFPAGFNPLTGQRVSDPARLEYPAILLSIDRKSVV